VSTDTHTHTRAHTRAHTHNRTRTSTHTHTHTHILTHTHAHIHTHTHTHAYVRIITPILSRNKKIDRLMSTRIHTINSLENLLRSVQGILLEINDPPPHPPIQACKTNLTHMHARTHIRSDIHTHTNIPARTHINSETNTHQPQPVRQPTISAGFALNCRGSSHHGIRPPSRRRRGGGART